MDFAEDLTTPGPFIHERSYSCYKCGLTYRESKMVNFRGHYFGIPCTCFRDIKDIVRKEMVDKRKVYK